MNKQDLIKIIRQIGKSKSIKRTGWVREGIKDSESVAEHSFKLAVLAFILAPQLKVDQDKLIKMAIIHDLGEIKTGDVVTARGGKVDYQIKEIKETEEKEFIRKIFKNHKEFVSLFEEITERKTEESKLLAQLDRLEMAFQALEYEKEQGVDLSEFFVDADLNIKDPFLKEIMDQVKKMRKKL